MSETKVKNPASAIEETLTNVLKLKSPRFQLECTGRKVSGSIIADEFRGMKDSDRQRRVWDALDKAYGPESVERVGTLLVFTPDEWDVDLQPDTE